jgi:hypothetical protein
MMTKLSKLQKAILREGLAYEYAKPVREAFQMGLKEHWAKRGSNRFLDEERPDGFDVRYSVCEVRPELGKHITCPFSHLTEEKEKEAGRDQQHRCEGKLC